MRQRSLAVPLLLILIGGLFLLRNAYPETPVFDIVSLYWPFLLIAWGLVRLAEVLFWRDARRSAMTGGEVFLVVIICLGGLGLFEVHRHGIRISPNIFGDEFEYPVETRGSAAGIKHVIFENSRGMLRVTGADGEEIVVTGHKLVRAYRKAEADRANDATPIELVTQGDQLIVYSHQDRAPGDQRVSDDLDITVPAGVSLEGRGDRGDFEITGVTGDVTLSSSRGDVRLARVGGNVRLDISRSGMIHAEDIHGSIDLQGSGSDVELENIAGQVTINGPYTGSLDFKNLAKPLRFDGARNTELRVEGVPGSINMDLGEFNGKNITGPVRLVTESHDVHLEDFTQSLELDTRRGDVELEPARVPLPKIEAHSGAGRIDLVLPEGKVNFQLQATVEHGDADNDFGPPIEKQVDGRTTILRGGTGDGPSIRITADRGSVSVRRQGNAAPVPPEPPRPSAEPPTPPAPPKPEVKL